MTDSSKRVLLITGASSGIGAATARAAIYALSQPPHVDVHELMVLPTPPLASTGD